MSLTGHVRSLTEIKEAIWTVCLDALAAEGQHACCTPICSDCRGRSGVIKEEIDG